MRTVLSWLIPLLFLVCVNPVSARPLVVSGHPEAPPISWKIKGDLAGVGPELTNQILQTLNTPYSYQLIKDWSAVQQAAKTGEIDLIVGAYRNAEREKYLVFSDGYIDSPVVIVVPRGQKFSFNGWEDLRGKRGVAHSGESFGEKFDNYIHTELNVTYGSYQMVFQHLSQGLADYLIMDLYPAVIYAKLLQAEDKVEFLDNPVTVQQFRIAIARRSPFVKLLPAINREIARLKKNGICKNLVKEQYLRWRETFLQRQRFFAQQYNRAEQAQQQWNSTSRDRALDTLSRFIEANRQYTF